MKFIFGIIACFIFSSVCWCDTESNRKHPQEDVETINDEKRSENSAPRIIDGERASVGEYPWMVSMYYKGRYVCGGSILNKNTILTAAHCVLGMKHVKQFLEIRTADIRMKKRDPFERRYFAKKVITHDKFSYEKKAARDIAIIKLKDDIKYNEYTQPIEIATRNKERLLRRVGRCSLSGFGITAEPPKIILPRTLQRIDLTLQSQSFCKKWFGTKTEEFDRYSICTYEEEIGSPCFGDSGSPLVCNDDKGKAYEVGVVSWGPNVCDTRYAFYARVSRNLRWINRHSR